MNSECSDCIYFDEGEGDNEPCWGDVKVVDEVSTGDDWIYVYACEGHADIASGCGDKAYSAQTRQSND